MRRIAVSIAAVAALAATPAQAAVTSSWVPGAPAASAVVNACDSGSHSLGVRATMPGDAAGRDMFTRFSAEWLDPATGSWTPVAGTESPWIDAGRGPWLYRETGWTRTFLPAPAGASFRLRGVVEMQWRSEGGGVARSQTVVTPEGCELR